MLSDGPSDKEGGSEAGDETWDWLTIMQGPNLSGRERIWFGRYGALENVSEDPGENPPSTEAEPVEHIPLPRSMTREEIRQWLETDDWGERYLETFDDPS